ncbi:MAG: acylphosphatase [Candidatus Aenigmatarchaeota archaeon]|nr:MAG: acylphosphatase [Candidatus Aenigmarchaeota archaeon]RLJ06725.1 MAG: acylphosphatase [Candidatus Aenigmarchaeota archaeon]RLJ06998.1 MAG: acylphosphatase [Candidatus Aenigmarchaeota archaeon]
MKCRARVLVSGLVQGVFFRAFTKETAARLGLTGWAKNLPTGEVEIVFEGEKERILKAIEHCRKGPPGARVESIDTRWEEFRNEFEDFEIRY